jgi:hypothetical protein
MSTTAHPQTDGQSEIPIRTVKAALLATEHLNADWTLRLPLVAMAYNSCDHSVPAQPPFLLAFGRQPQPLSFRPSAS